jgi:MraZ protein
VREFFRGEPSQKVDAKARVSIPASFRRTLESGDPDFLPGARAHFVIVYGDPRDPAVECYTVRKMDAMVAALMDAPPTTPNLALAKRLLIQMSCDAEIDDEGRIVLPLRVREKLEVGPEEAAKGFEAVFAGQGDRFQIWKRDSFEAKKRQQISDALARLPTDGDILGILGDLPDPTPGA